MSSKTIFPPGLKMFGIEPANIIFLELQKSKDILWVMEEALKCIGVAAVVGEISDLSFTLSRRLQLAVEQSGVMGFILRRSRVISAQLLVLPDGRSLPCLVLLKMICQV
jgi:protein ImuA